MAKFAKAISLQSVVCSGNAIRCILFPQISFTFNFTIIFTSFLITCFTFTVVTLGIKNPRPCSQYQKREKMQAFLYKNFESTVRFITWVIALKIDRKETQVSSSQNLNQAYPQVLILHFRRLHKMTEMKILTVVGIWFSLSRFNKIINFSGSPFPSTPSMNRTEFVQSCKEEMGRLIR